MLIHALSRSHYVYHMSPSTWLEWVIMTDMARKLLQAIMLTSVFDDTKGLGAETEVKSTNHNTNLSLV